MKMSSASGVRWSGSYVPRICLSESGIWSPESTIHNPATATATPFACPGNHTPIHIYFPIFSLLIFNKPASGAHCGISATTSSCHQAKSSAYPGFINCPKCLSPFCGWSSSSSSRHLDFIFCFSPLPSGLRFRTIILLFLNLV